MFETYQKWLPMMVYEQQPGLAVRKEIYRLRGLLDVAQVRHPGANISDTAANALNDMLNRTVGSDVDISRPLIHV